METNTIIKGYINSNSTGNAYLINDEIDDLFIHKSNLNKALHNDYVEVRVTKYRNSINGEVIEIIKRDRTEFVGTINIQKDFAFVRPSSKKINVDFYLPIGTYENIKEGEKVIIKMGKWNGKSPSAKVIKRLGTPGENEVEICSIMHEYDIKNGFDEKVLREVGKISELITDEEIEKRRDFRELVTIAIDPEGCRDRDDAISYQKLPNGNTNVGIHIADVTHYVKKGTELDKEAHKRGTSVYLVDRVIPMLPEKLSNDICSLNKGTDKLTYSFIFTFDKNNNIIDQWFGKGIVNLNETLSYELAQEMIDNNDTTEIGKSLIDLNNIAKKLRDKRDIIEFDKQEISFKLDENSKPIGIYVKKSQDTNKLIEEFMLLTNHKVGEFIFKKGKPSIYRAHDRPDIDKIQELSEFIKDFGYTINSNAVDIKSELNKLLSDIKGKNEENLISTLIVRAMPKAKCTSDKIHGHYGLSMEHYSWTTSPIRRYADIVLMRCLSDILY